MLQKQVDMVLNHLKEIDSITQKEANDLYGISRLSARVYDLKKMGYNIGKTTEKVVNRYGNPIRVAKYYLTF
jgi:hypothetical protein